MDFYVPNYLSDDYDSLLDSLGTDCILSNMYTQTSIKGIFNLLDFKSNMRGLSDNTREFRCSRSVSIKRGDYIVDNNNITYIVNWTPYLEINCYQTQVQICNVEFNFERWQDVVLNSNGIASTPASYVDVASNVKGYATRMSMEVFNAKSGEVGVEPSQIIIAYTQANTATLNLNITDEFQYFNNQYQIIDIDYTQLNSDNTGILALYAKVLEGGRRASS